MDSCTKQKDLVEHLASKSQEEFAQTYTSYDEATAREICLAIFAELKKAVILNDTQLLTTLNKLTDNINNTNNKVKLETYYNNSDNNLRNTNLVILACKHNSQISLEYLFNNYKFLKSIHCALSPCDEDDSRHNAFYYAMRLNKITILQILTGEWPGVTSREINELLSQAYEELKLKNVALSNEMEAFVEDTLISLRFYADDSPGGKNDQVTVGNIRERIDLVLENIYLINSEYKNLEVDEKFLYVAKFIVKNIHILKRHLRSTYNRLPWEEIEFCLISFIKSCMTREEINLLYKSILTKENILYHLSNFALILSDVKTLIENGNVVNLRRLPNIQRDNIIEAIIQNNPSFKALYENYTEIIDVYSLNRIKYYTDLAMAVDSTKKEEQLIIIRALQVLGEYTKNTLESPKLSTTTSQLLLQTLQNDTKDIVKNLRNSLSHSNSLYKRTQIESRTDVSFFTNIQEDIKKINMVITEILYNLKLKRIRTLLKNMIDSSSLTEIRVAVEVFKFINFEEMISETNTPENYAEVEELIEKLIKKICDKTSYDEKFNVITKIIKLEKENLIDIKSNYFHGLQQLRDYGYKDFDNDMIDNNEIISIKYFAQKTLECLSQKVELYNFKNVDYILKSIFMEVNSRIGIQQTEEEEELLLLFHKVIQTVNDLGNIKWVEELRDKIKETGDHFRSDCEQKEEAIVPHKEFEAQLTLKLSVLEDILNKNSEKLKCKKIQIILEMLLLDIMSILGSFKNCLNENFLYLDDNLPLLTGKNLRNHLAHGNTLIDILSLNPTTAVLSNTAKLTKDNITLINKKIGKRIKYDFLKLKRIHNQNIMTIINQRKMFTSIAEGNFQEAKNCIKNGADVKARSTNLWTSLHFASKQSNLNIVKFLLDQNLNVDTKDVKQQSALHIAAIYGNKSFLELFIQNHKVIIDDPDCTGKTLLHLAALNGHKDIIELLLKNKASTTITDFLGHSPLHCAVRNGQTDAAKMLLRKEQHVDLNQIKGGHTSLFIAAKNGHMEIVNFLLENHANVKARNTGGCIPLHGAAINGHLNIVDALISRGSDVNTRAEDGCTPLHYAAESNHEKVVQLLIKRGANVNLVDKIYLNTPLNYAAKGGYKGLVEIFLKNGADINKKTIINMTSLHVAARFGHLDIVNLLLESKACINSKSIEDETALHLSCYEGHIEVVKLLLKNKSNLNARDKNNRTSLHFAAAKGHIDVVKFLLLEGANVNSVEASGSTPLHLCCTAGNGAIAKILIDAGADIYLRNNLKFTALEEASKNDFCDVVEILMEAGHTLNSIIALHVAVVSGSKKVVEMLLNKNVNINGDYGEENYVPPLCLAVEFEQIEIAKILIQRGCIIDARFINNETPLCSAVRKNLKEIVNILLAKGADVNFEEGLPLKLAIISRHKNIAKLLLAHKKINLKFKDSNNITFLHYAASVGDKHTAEVLLKRGCDVDASAPTLEGETPLLGAVANNHKDIVEVLLANKANPNIMAESGNIPLHVAAEKGAADIIDLLLKAGANCNLRDKKYRLPIELAVVNGRLNIVKMLMKYTNIHTRGFDGWTMLHMAAQGDHLEVAKYLVENGININTRNEKGSKPIHIAARHGSQKILQYLFDKTNSLNDYGAARQNLLHYSAIGGQLEMVKYLIDQKFDINFRDMNGCTALYHAASFGFKEIVETLLNNGSNYKSAFNKKTVNEAISDKVVIKLLKINDRLYEAVKNNKEVEVESCINEGAVVNIKNSDYVTPLHQASCKGFETMVEILLQHKANPNMLGKGGCTPLHYAANFGHIGIVRKLLSHGAIYDVRSDTNKIPLDLAKHQATIDLLKLLDESFKSVQNGNSKIVSKLNKIKDIDTIKAIMNARNTQNKTVVVVAIQSEFPEIEQLKGVFQDNDDNVKAAKMIVGQLHIDTINTHFNMANILFEQGRYHDVLKIYNKSLAPAKNILGENHHLVVEGLIRMAIIKEKFKLGGPEGLKLYEYLNSDIHTAAANGNRNIIESLIVDGTDVNTTDSEGRTPLHFAVSNNHNEIVLQLLQHNADVTFTTNKGDTALHIAASKGNKDIIKILLNHLKQNNNKKLIDAKTNYGGSSALHVAAKNNSDDIVNILLEYGAAYNLTDKNNKTPSDLSTSGNLTNLFKFLDDFFKDAENGNHKLINKLQIMNREHFIVITNARNKQGNTLLQVAMINKHKDLARKLGDLKKINSKIKLKNEK